MNLDETSRHTQNTFLIKPDLHITGLSRAPMCIITHIVSSFWDSFWWGLDATCSNQWWWQTLWQKNNCTAKCSNASKIRFPCTICNFLWILQSIVNPLIWMRDLGNFLNCTRRKESFETESAISPAISEPMIN